MMGKKALLVVSFGTSTPEVIERCIVPVEKALCEAATDYDFYRAFTSGIIRKKLKNVYDISIDAPQEALEKLQKKGYSKIIVWPTHMMSGFEYHALETQVKAFTKQYPEIDVVYGETVIAKNNDRDGFYSKNAVDINDNIDNKKSVNNKNNIDRKNNSNNTNNSDNDIIRLVQSLKYQIPTLAADEAVLFMGHGTEHEANDVYFKIRAKLQQMSEQLELACVEAAPLFEDAVKHLKTLNIQKVYLMPLMVVAGDHAMNDMAGDDENSWEKRLENTGFEAIPVLKGLGENEDFCRIYQEKIEKIM